MTIGSRECFLQQNHDFRFIDHGDKIGVSSTNQMDHVVSTEFFDQEKQDLKGNPRGRVSSGRIQALLEFRPATKILAKLQ